MAGATGRRRHIAVVVDADRPIDDFGLICGHVPQALEDESHDESESENADREASSDPARADSHEESGREERREKRDEKLKTLESQSTSDEKNP